MKNSVPLLFGEEERMKTLLSLFKQSFLELKNTRNLTTLAMLMALQLVLSLFGSIPLSDSLKLSCSFLASSAIGMLFGPFCAALTGGLVDVMQAFIKPTGPFFPGFTLTAVLGGIIYGCFLYKDKPTLPRIILSKALVNLLLNIGMNSYWLYLLYGYGFWGMIPSRGLKNLILLPIEVILLYLILPQISKIYRSVSKPTKS